MEQYSCIKSLNYVEKFDKNEMVTNSATNSDEVFIIIQQIRQKFRQKCKENGKKM